MQEHSPWDVLKREAPVYPEMIDAYIGKTFAASGLDERTIHLIWIAVQTALDYDLAVKVHVPLALQAGATEREIVGAAAIAGAAAGPKGFVKCFPLIIDEVNHYRDKNGN